jgi:phosphoribosylcarboxyaminoimidazole (NCAIR) mutase
MLALADDALAARLEAFRDEQKNAVLAMTLPPEQ